MRYKSGVVHIGRKSQYACLILVLCTLPQAMWAIISNGGLVEFKVYYSIKSFVRQVTV